MNQTIEAIGKRARAAQAEVALLSDEKRDAFLQAAADLLVRRQADILAANQKDLTAAAESGMPQPMQDRLMLNEARILQIASAAKDLIKLPCPVGKEIDRWERPNGLVIQRKRVPIGVIGIIFEARPNVTVDASLLCAKAGNVVVLRGGREALLTNQVLVNILRDAAASLGITPDMIQLLTDTSHETAAALMEATEYLDLLIPRGSKRLIQAVKQNARVPVIETGAGNCHLYVDKAADLQMANRIVYNAKTSRPSVCNAIETVLVHRDVAEQFLPLMKQTLDQKQVLLYGCARTRAILGESVLPADEEAYATEFDDYILAVKVVDSLKEAIEHINHYSTKHSEGIITADQAAADQFAREIQSAVVYVNASTRFTDGGEFGFGAEIGISTGKLHARGPMGLNELTTVQYLVTGNGQIRE
jgi:glutamate-5-semialdehyde dehydrogenase